MRPGCLVVCVGRWLGGVWMVLFVRLIMVWMDIFRVCIGLIVGLFIVVLWR